MAVKIELKRSSVPGKIPTTASLELGELAINTYDGVAYLKREVNTTQSIVALLTTAFTSSYMESSSYAQTASYAPNYTLLSSFGAFTSSYNTGSFTGFFTGLLQGTASWAVNAVTASYFSGSISNAVFAATSSYAFTASYIDPANLPVLLSYQIATGSITASVDVAANQIFLIKSSSKPLFKVDSSGSVTTSGSITVTTTGSYDKLLSVNNNQKEYLGVNGEGVLILNQFATPPTAVSGGIYLDTVGDFYFGV